MKTKLDLFPSVYCVSLVESKQRRRELISQFKEYGVSDITFSLSERLANSDDQWIGDEYIKCLCDTGKSTCINHIKNIYDWYTSTDDAYGFFCEDDISLETVKYWNFTWSEFINALPPEWECVQLYSIRTHEGHPIDEIKLRIREWYDWGAQAFIMKRSYAKKVLDAYYPDRSQFKLVSVNHTRFTDESFIDPDLHRCPFPETLLFSGLGQVLNIPLILESISIGTTYDKESTHQYKWGHDYSYNAIRNWWINNQTAELSNIMKIQKPGQLIDCFMYYDERELLELRIKLLNPYVDKFLIFEGDRFFSGLPKPFTCRQVLNELGIQNNKIEVIEVYLPSDEQLVSGGLDFYMKEICPVQDLRGTAVGYWTRERMQRDAFLTKKNEFEENDVFIFSNCDEIIKPLHLNYLPEILRNNRQLVLKLPLVKLQTRANLREHFRDTLDPVPDDNSAFMCMKHHFNECSPAQIRAGCSLPFSVHYAVQNNKRIEDIGWHFKRQGKTSKPYEDNNICVLPYPEKYLPHIIYSLPNVKRVLLPQHTNKSLTIQDKLKDIPIINCITLQREFYNVRKQEMIDKLKAAGINTIKFIENKPLYDSGDVWFGNNKLSSVDEHSISISINHIKAIKNWFETTNDEYGVFCEDDLSLETVNYWNFTWNDVIDRLPEDWECVQLSNIRTQFTPIDTIKITQRLWYDWGTQFFIMKRSYAKKILDTYYVRDGTYILICMDPNAQPLTENLLYIGLGKVYNIPLFVEEYNIKHEHFNNAVKNLWKSYQHTGCLDDIMRL
jgi:hypothetical protein